jgi:hypothetical protein
MKFQQMLNTFASFALRPEHDIFDSCVIVVLSHGTHGKVDIMRDT